MCLHGIKRGAATPYWLGTGGPSDAYLLKARWVSRMWVSHARMGVSHARMWVSHARMGESPMPEFAYLIRGKVVSEAAKRSEAYINQPKEEEACTF